MFFIWGILKAPFWFLLEIPYAFIPPLIQTVVAYIIPDGIGAFFITLVRNYDLALMFYSTFILDWSGRSYSKQFP